MFIQIIVMFEDFVAILARSIGWFSVHEDHVPPHIGIVFRTFATKRTFDDRFPMFIISFCSELHDIYILSCKIHNNFREQHIQDVTFP